MSILGFTLKNVNLGATFYSNFWSRGLYLLDVHTNLDKKIRHLVLYWAEIQTRDLLLVESALSFILKYLIGILLIQADVEWW